MRPPPTPPPSLCGAAPGTLSTWTSSTTWSGRSAVTECLLTFPSLTILHLYHPQYTASSSTPSTPASVSLAWLCDTINTSCILILCNLIFELSSNIYEYSYQCRFCSVLFLSDSFTGYEYPADSIALYCIRITDK